MAIYLGYTLGNAAPAMTGSLDDVVLWGKRMLIRYSIVKIARARSERSSVIIIADLTSDGISFLRTPRVLHHSQAKRLCRKVTKKQ
jgi:hypothetical protein